MDAIQTSLAALQEGSALAANFPYVAPIAGLLLHALTTQDEVKQYKEECELMMRKVARVANIVVNICGKHNLNEEDLPASLLAIMGSLQRELDKIERVLKKCSRKKGLGRLFLRRNLLTRIRQCDGELSNVLQAFQAELSLDTRFTLIADRRELSYGYQLRKGYFIILLFLLNAFVFRVKVTPLHTNKLEPSAGPRRTYGSMSASALVVVHVRTRIEQPLRDFKVSLFRRNV
jgi:hypothetical protein